MTHGMSALAFAGLLAFAQAGPVARRGDGPAQSSAPASTLQIQVVAMDRSGAPVTDLRPEELELWLGPYRVPIESVTAVLTDGEAGPQSIVLVLDDLTMSPAIAPRVREAARRFVTRMAPGDTMAVMSLDGDITDTTDDRAVLLKRIDDYRTPSGGIMPFDRLGEHVLKTLRAIAAQLVEVPGRKTIVGIGPSWLFDTPIPPPTLAPDLRREWTETMRTMAIAKATFYVLDPGGVGAQRADSGTSGLARETGGRAIGNTNDLNAAADHILRETGSYYILNAAEPNVMRKSELREVDVRTRRRGITVRARRWIPGKM